MRNTLVAAALTAMLWGTGAVAQYSLPKPLFGKGAPRWVPPARHVAVPPKLDMEKLDRLRTQAQQQGITITPGDAGGQTIYADRRVLAAIQPKATPQQQRGTIAVALGTALLEKVGIPSPQLVLERQWQDELGMTHTVLQLSLIHI